VRQDANRSCIVRASLKVIGNAAAVGLGDLSDSSKRPQIGCFTWFQDHPTPSNFIEPLLTCRAFVPRSQDNLNVAEFCDRRIDAEIRRADSLQLRDPAAAGELWSRIDHELVDRASWVPLYNPRTVTAQARASATTSTTHSGTCCWISSGFAEGRLGLGYSDASGMKYARTRTEAAPSGASAA
jgi:ABC-type transport system substrate-binding protein